MGTRKVSFANGEFYHIYNRGVDKRTIFEDVYDVQRFLQSILEFNTITPIGSLYENSFCEDDRDVSGRDERRLVNVIAYCLNPNHFHMLIEQVSDGGISEFMKRIGGGYTVYFNNKHQRSGALFQGTFKSSHVDTNEYLLHVSAYVNLNDRVHKLGGLTAKLVESVSSWEEYTDTGIKGICQKRVILEQFRNPSEYQKFALASLKTIQKKKEDMKSLANLLFEDPLGG